MALDIKGNLPFKPTVMGVAVFVVSVGAAVYAFAKARELVAKVTKPKAAA